MHCPTTFVRLQFCFTGGIDILPHIVICNIKLCVKSHDVPGDLYGTMLHTIVLRLTLTAPPLPYISPSGAIDKCINCSNFCRFKIADNLTYTIFTIIKLYVAPYTIWIVVFWDLISSAIVNTEWYSYASMYTSRVQDSQYRSCEAKKHKACTPKI